MFYDFKGLGMPWTYLKICINFLSSPQDSLERRAKKESIIPGGYVLVCCDWTAGRNGGNSGQVLSGSISLSHEVGGFTHGFLVRPAQFAFWVPLVPH